VCTELGKKKMIKLMTDQLLSPVKRCDVAINYLMSWCAPTESFLGPSDR
jgi:hypothetical protein